MIQLKFETTSIQMQNIIFICFKVKAKLNILFPLKFYFLAIIKKGRVRKNYCITSFKRTLKDKSYH